MQVEAKASPTLQQLIDKYQSLPSEVDLAVRKGVTKVAGEFRIEVSSERGLKMFQRRKPGTPTPSRPGQPPGMVTTGLLKSIRLDKSERLGHAHWAQNVGAYAKYSRAQEMGNPKQNLPARPFMEPASKRVMRRAHLMFTQEVAKVLRERRHNG